MTTRDEVLGLLEQHRGLTPSQVATQLALPHERVKKAMQRLARAGQLTAENGFYSLVPALGPRDNGPRILVTRDAWEDTPLPPRYVDRGRYG